MKPNEDHLPNRMPLSEDELRAAYAAARAKFSAADLQLYTVEEEGIPLGQVIAEMKEIHRQAQEANGKS